MVGTMMGQDKVNPKHAIILTNKKTSLDPTLDKRAALSQRV